MKSRFLVAGLLLAAALQAAAQVDKVEKAGSTTYYGAYTPAPVRTLADLPRPIRSAVLQHLRMRVGDQFASLLKFDSGEAVNRAELRRVEPNSENYQWEVPAYELRFSFREPRAGIDRYIVQLAVRENGTLIQKPDVPAFRTSPQKLNFFSLRSAWKVAERNGIDPRKGTVELSYEPKSDQIVWNFAQPVADDGVVIKLRNVAVSAHDGRVVTKGTSEAIR